jgi:chromate transport protein ChrA
MNPSSSSFGVYETGRIIVPGFYFASLVALLYRFFLIHYLPYPLETSTLLLLFILILLIAGLTMYAQETPKRRRAFVENQPSSYVQGIARTLSDTELLEDTEARQLYFYILNNYMPASFHEKIFFFGTIYHIMIQIRRTSFWFGIIFLAAVAMQIASGVFVQSGALLIVAVLVWIVYGMNVRYNKADRKMQENYQDQIYWLEQNSDIVLTLLKKQRNKNRKK